MTEPFDFDRFVALPRLSGLQSSPDGSRLVVAVATPGPDGKDLRSALWQVDPSGETPPHRLTRSAVGESNAEFLPDGSLLFISARPDPDAKATDKPTDTPDDKPPKALWHLPAGGGEARLLLAPAGGVTGIAVARDSGTILLFAPLHVDVADFDADRERQKARKDAGVSALLFEGYPIRYWDHYLGPRDGRYFVAEVPDGEASLTDAEDLTGPSGTALPEPDFDIAPDGRSVATTWRRFRAGATGDDIVVIDRSTRERRNLTGDVGWSAAPAFSPDGRQLAVARGREAAPDVPERFELVVYDLESGAARVVAGSLDRWPVSPIWTPDGAAILFTADDEGAVPIYRVDLASDAVTRLAGGAAFSDIAVSPDGGAVFALRASLDRPPHVVRLDSLAADQDPVEVRSPATPAGELPRTGVVERLSATADDGVAIGSWLMRPAKTSSKKPAPLVVFVHGGPLGTWAGWSWRWNANLLVERGYAVLMPDPALSTGYGQAFIDRGWGTWGERPYTDVLTAVDGALERPDIDRSRTALMGGSFGGYMANWVAGHTDRFKAIVTHASLWELRGFHGATDDGIAWEQEIGNPYEDASRYHDNSPSKAVADIKTPMLVIHGELDARVPISEALRLWTDLQRHGVDAKFLYFPDENHWIAKPQNARVWYETVLAFLDRYVLDAEWKRPALL